MSMLLRQRLLGVLVLAATAMAGGSGGGAGAPPPAPAVEAAGDLSVPKLCAPYTSARAATTDGLTAELLGPLERVNTTAASWGYYR